jgi:threonylcarbamoyladenosine tRNA methylthiotransferase MtaB
MKAAFYTLGCKVNQCETEYMSELLKNAGFEIVAPDEEADFYIVNSCTVTATADQKSRQNIRKFKRNHPDSAVILTGCMPQAFPEEAAKLTEADIVMSNRDDADILNLINQYLTDKKRFVRISEHKSGDKFGECSISSFNSRIRAFVKIEDGCDRFCSYCIIPKARGRVRSKPLESLKNEIDLLASNGVKEIVLVGINLSAYGKNEDFNIVDAVKLCAENDGIKRIRLGSLEPDHITDEILDGLSKIKKFCPQFHLSLQSGCNKTLKNMNRHYTAEDYKALCDSIRSRFEDASITTDIMVGFHDESPEDFSKTMEFVKSVAFEKVHVFPYSERRGTAASKRGDNVPKAEKERRAAELITLSDGIRNEYLKSFVGKTVEVLFENEIMPGIYQGYTRDYFPVRCQSDSNIIGKNLNVTVKEANQEFCIAE